VRGRKASISPSRLFEFGSEDYELYEDEDVFVLMVEMPGFDPADIDVTWNEGVLNVAAEREEGTRNQHKTYHRRFCGPEAVDDEDTTVEYNNGILEVRLPVTESDAEGPGDRGPGLKPAPSVVSVTSTPPFQYVLSHAARRRPPPNGGTVPSDRGALAAGRGVPGVDS
jgi:HSP20 family protein